MTAQTIVGSVGGLWRFPVKSMRGERLAQVEVTAYGLVGDRAYALMDADTGKVASAKSVKRFPGLLACSAVFVEPPQPGKPLPAVRITMPDGHTVTSDVAGADSALSAYFRRNVTLSSAAPEDFTIDQYHPDVADLDPAALRDTVVDQKLGSALFAELGAPSPVPVGFFFDLFAVSVLTTSTLERLTELRPETRFDERRFRMNVTVDTNEPGFVENDWVGRELAIGEAARLRIALPDPRCVMTTLPQEELPSDAEVLRTLLRHNRIPVSGAATPLPCAGVYAIVEAPGLVRIGDRVILC